MHSAIESEFSTRSGVFALASEKVSMTLNSYGEYDYVVEADLTQDETAAISKLDGLRNADEDEISRDLFGDSEGISYDPVIGYHSGLYCGYASEGTFRAQGSSGGITSWILAELLKKGLVDGVITATRAATSHAHFEYAVLRSPQEIRDSAKSRYYPLEFSGALSSIRAQPGRYAIVGIPSFISDVRRLQRHDPVFAERIAFTVALLCGHQKSTKYGESIAFEAGFNPGDAEQIDFRYKTPGGVAAGYVTEVIGKRGGIEARQVVSAKEAYATDWSAGMFKTRFSDLIDDCFGETADITLGDAWIAPYISDPLGTNVVVVRNESLRQLLEAGAKEGRLKLDVVDPKTVKASQSGLIRHYRDELPYRLSHFRAHGIRTRVRPSAKLPLLRRRVQDLRIKIASESKQAYAEAVARSDWDYFVQKMDPLLHKYRRTYRLIRLQNLGPAGLTRRLLEKITIFKNANIDGKGMSK
ncbi:Coenzyme F420 hydrogenase/dehydrogenase, beta subunit C-terminal domain [Microbacterium aurantiacum]|uniref:Coenzyme F420 hydrogenase/dehydrogenase, beta subunit C-terminal domain n=1 Tax=Microbacterium aurantiacum TaxID=162393 RepID=A0ABT8FUY9_9MICO|nr:Coenzyme F420 hydrogenase/dehydrogenase, beta subunit C-terminal domain [Microbacterium aurantiacum]MDN4465134.1 Coenzyme F420 hydrogenase/dehydrogenase, beta subunit C-terminal domain [Microbacterium aurantiacum]